MINIANYLITRKCNMSCDYCRIALTKFDNYILRPSKYPDKKHYIKNEKSGTFWNELSDRLVKHNPDIFFILYGGEFFLHPEHIDIVKHMKQKDMNYTIISSANDGIRPLIEKMFEEVGEVYGFSCSVDPGFWKEDEDKSDERVKSKTGFEFLKWLIKNKLTYCPVAEITVDDKNIFDLVETVKILSDEGITCSITCMDNAHNNAYDFSAIENPNIITRPHKDIKKIFDELKDEQYRILYKETILDKLYESLPSKYDCKLEDNLHNITVDSDGRLRCCLRMRGYRCSNYEMLGLIDQNGNFTEDFEMAYMAMKSDKDGFCTGCNWTCPMMSSGGM